MRNRIGLFGLGKGRHVRKNPSAMAIIGITLLVFLFPALGVGEIPGGEVRFQASAFTLPSIKGQSVSLNDYKGQVVLLNFWATWCRDCAREMPEFEKLYQAYKEKGLSVLAIALDKEGGPAVETFLKKENLKLTYPVLLDADGRIARAYRLAWIPVTLIVGRGGTILETVHGAKPWGSQEVMDSFEQLLNTGGND